MVIFHQVGTRAGFGLACVCLSAACAAPTVAQTDPYATASDAPGCRYVVGQAEIDGVMQQIGGLACLQPDGSWQIVQNESAPLYYYDPWYWGPPVVFGVGVSFVFVDRFHHFHHMDHVRYGRGPYAMGGHGGWHGASSMHGWGGISHGGGGGMRR